MFPPIDTFNSGLLPVDDGNEIYWETSGNPKGKPALFLHGGPGSGIRGGYRRHYDPEKFFIVGFEQRGCGRSRPLATDPSGDLSTNTTTALIADMEALRKHLGIEKWLLYGASWGTTLALAYAQEHPQQVTEMVLAAVTSSTAAEVEWITEEMGRVFPREWDAFRSGADAAPGERLVDAYHRQLTDADPGVRETAALNWCVWEDVHMSLDPKSEPRLQFEPPGFRLLFATLVTHYWRNAGFVEGLLETMVRIQHIPSVLIHGRLDVSSPLSTAWSLHKVWPASELVVVEEGHGGMEMVGEIDRAVARFTPAD
ncbi:prolyl aminopeptidase [Arthrobacter sp. H5]|uniref:prolyl aminopeptidase n=1 Tax=Arthrobacter sp. H5 TaxID=1267973 RepID=UPI000481DCA1|nr:prolyl aminopeptidase [Arthrobacter sp. H5]